MSNSRKLKLELQRKIKRAEQFLAATALVFAFSFLVWFVGMFFDGGGQHGVTALRAWGLVWLFCVGFGPLLIGALRYEHLRRQRESGHVYGAPWFALFTDRSIHANTDERLSIGLSGTMVLCCSFPLLLATPLCLLGLIETFKGELKASILVLFGTPFIAIGLGGLGLTWRSEFDKRRGTLTIWNWLGKHEFPLDQVHRVRVIYESGSSSGRSGGHRDATEAGISPSGSGRSGHGPLWHVYIEMNDTGGGSDDHFKIHVAKVESRRQSAQRMADAIRGFCDCPLIDPQVAALERARIREIKQQQKEKKRSKRPKRKEKPKPKRRRKPKTGESILKRDRKGGPGRRA